MDLEMINEGRIDEKIIDVLLSIDNQRQQSILYNVF